MATEHRTRKAELGKKAVDPAPESKMANFTLEPPRNSSQGIKQLDLLSPSLVDFEISKEKGQAFAECSASTDDRALPQLALDDACKILKVKKGDSWEKVELARRKIVQKSSPNSTRNMPTEQVQKFLSEAKLANDAAIVIAARRSGFQ